MKEEIKASVVVAVYNVKNYLKQCIDSLCNQTLKEIEIICVDDGSNDGSLEILFDYSKEYKNITVLKNKIDGVGAANARNMGLDYAKGEYVLVLDSDDYFHEEMLEKAYNKAVENNAEVVIFDAWEFDSNTGEIFSYPKYLKQDLIPKMSIFNLITIADYSFQLVSFEAWNKLIKLEHLKQYNIKFKQAPVADDLFFTYSAMINAEKITILNEKLLYYRINNNGSQSNKKGVYPLRCIEFIMEIKNILLEKNIFDKLENSFVLWTTEVIRWYWEACIRLESFSLLYNELKSNALNEIGICDKNINFVSKGVQKWIEDIGKYSCDEYLFYNYQVSDAVEVGMFRFQFPKELFSKDDKVILYGAGVVGKVFYAQNTLYNFCDIIAWVDRNYKNLPSPVVGLEVLLNTDYNKILIANENTIIQNKIVDSLISMGIPKEKIKRF